MSTRSAHYLVALTVRATMRQASANASGFGLERSAMPEHVPTNALAMVSVRRRVCAAVLLAGSRRIVPSTNAIGTATSAYATLGQGHASAMRAISQQTAVRSYVKARV